MLSTIFACLFIVLLCMCVGSVHIPLVDELRIIGIKLTDISDSISPSIIAIFWDIRMPRALTAFLVGGILSLSGCIMQAVLQNPLASTYTLGISAGASLGAAIVIVLEITIPVLGGLLLPTTGFLFGLGTVLLVLGISRRLDRGLKSNTIILLGMVISLFVNAMLSLLTSLSGPHAQQLVLWQMGSFAGKRWWHVGVLTCMAILGLLISMHYHRELDILTFGDVQSASLGVDTGKVKWRVLLLATLLTGVSVCFSGIIGFVDLIVPHAVRRVFGAAHRVLLPMSFVLGGTFMAVADLIARTIVSPSELGVGAVTAIIGAPVFVVLFFYGREK